MREEEEEEKRQFSGRQGEEEGGRETEILPGSRLIRTVAAAGDGEQQCGELTGRGPSRA